MIKTEFRIPKMDCMSEERLIRLKLDELAGIKSLDFDIPQRRLTVLHEGDPEALLHLLEPLNLSTEIISVTQDYLGEIKASSSDFEEAVLLKKLLYINGFMFVVELMTGILADSMGLISDSLDMLADSSVYLISLFAVGKSLSVKKKSARLNGLFQLILGTGVLIETGRKYLYGSDPEPSYMVLVSLVALVANIYCLYLLAKHKQGDVHMRASYICSSTDVMANSAVVLAGITVYLSSSPIPDLVVGLVVTLIVIRGALMIFKISK